MTTLIGDRDIVRRPHGLAGTSRTAGREAGLLSRLLATEDDYAALAARLALGIVMLPHGAQKLLGWFGGYGLAGTIGWFTGVIGVPAPLALLVIAAESIGALALIAGALSRVAAFGIAATMLGATFMVHLPNGFFMNWSGNQSGEGFEFHLLAIGLAAAVMIRGGGAWSVDRVLDRRPI